jgi:hypothetical protein
MTNNNSAKFAFFYLLSLVSLIFTALGAGMIVFQIINKYVIDVIEQYPGILSQGTLKFAISSLVIAAPIYFVSVWQIQKNLRTGALDKDSGVRRWLTYFILLVSSVVMIGWLIATLNSFLDGELTTKFILKSLTAILISAIIFSFYLYEIKRESVVGQKSKIIRIYFVSSLVLIMAVFISALLIVESPTQARNRKIDNNILSELSQINSEINNYFQVNKKLPQDFSEIKAQSAYLSDDLFQDNLTKNNYEYKVIGDRTYELCAEFLISNKMDKNDLSYYWGDEWRHDAGRQCFKKDVVYQNNYAPFELKD